VLLFVARQVVAEVDYSIAQISLDGRKVSFLNYKNFDKDAHAELLQSIRVHLPSASYAIRDYSSSDNPPILHRKEAFVDPLYRYFIDFAALTRQEEGSWSSIATGNRLQERMASLAERETSTDRRPPDTRQERWCREQRKILKSGDSAITKFDRARIWQLSCVAVFEQFWAMRNGSAGRYGNRGNAESASCRFEMPFQGSNPTLTARNKRLMWFSTA
jgi:hypothetical protein